MLGVNQEKQVCILELKNELAYEAILPPTRLKPSGLKAKSGHRESRSTKIIQISASF